MVRHSFRIYAIILILGLIGIAYQSTLQVDASGTWHQITHDTWDNTEISLLSHCHCCLDPIQNYMALLGQDNWYQNTYEEFSTFTEQSNLMCWQDISPPYESDSMCLNVDSFEIHEITYTPESDSIIYDNPNTHQMRSILQTFSPTDDAICSDISLMIYRVGNPHYHDGAGNQIPASLTITLCEWANGVPRENYPLVYICPDADDIGTSQGTWRHYHFTEFYGSEIFLPHEYAQGGVITYAFVVSSNSDGDSSDSYRYEYKTFNSQDSIGKYKQYKLVNGQWSTTWETPDPAYDYPFKIQIPTFYSSGYQISRVYDTTDILDAKSKSISVSAQYIHPAGTTANIWIRTGNTSSPDSSWSNWYLEFPGIGPEIPEGRYVQNKMEFYSPTSVMTAHLYQLHISYAPGGGWFQSVEIPSGPGPHPPILSVKITGEVYHNQGTINIYVRNDPENSWHQIDLGDEYEFNETGSSLAYKIELIRGNNAPESPKILTLTIDYET